jgi:hypothetical protein
MVAPASGCLQSRFIFAIYLIRRNMFLTKGILVQGSETVLLARTTTVTRVRVVSKRTMQTSTISTYARTMEDERKVKFAMVNRRTLGALQTTTKTISNSVIVRVEAA